jgi:diadenosine tetraphosphate (Ap4A) HIT family hydrolase
MNCVNNCRFCNIFKGKQLYGAVDTLLFDTSNFAVFPTIGALVEGWVLIVPKEHNYSMRSYYSDNYFKNFIDTIKGLLYKQYNKPIIIFEHGANECGSLTSCGTNHAHLHMLPFNDSILNDMQQEIKWNKCQAEDINEIVKEKEYLYYCELSKEKFNQTDGYIHILSSPISQYFRKLLAKKIGQPDKYNYKDFPNLEIALKTHNDLFQGVSL